MRRDNFLQSRHTLLRGEMHSRWAPLETTRVLTCRFTLEMAVVYFWFFDGLLALTCLWALRCVWRHPGLRGDAWAAAFALLGVAALLGAARDLSGWDGVLAGAHRGASAVYPIAGHALLLLAMTRLIWSRLQAPLWTAIALLLSLAVFVLQQQSLLQLPWLGAALGGLFSALCVWLGLRLWRAARGASLHWLSAAALYPLNGLVIGGGPAPLLGLDIRAAVFHLLLAAWVLLLCRAIALTLKDSDANLDKRSSA